MTESKEIFLIGVGNLTEVIIELAQDCGFIVKGLYHYDSSRDGELVLDIPILSSFDSLINKQNIENINFAVTVGENIKRNEIATIIRTKKGKTPNLIHPSSYISNSAKIGTGTFIHAFSYIWTKAIIGDDCSLSPNSLVSHHSQINDACYITSFSIIGSYNKIGIGTFVGLNSVTLPNITIGNYSFIGAKSNVTKNFPKNSILLGNPAKQKKT